MTRVAIIAAALLLGIAPAGVRPIDAASDGLIGYVPRQCDSGASAGCACSGVPDCAGADCRPVPLQVVARGVLTIVADDGIAAYAGDDGSSAGDVGTVVTRAFTLLVDIKIAGQKHLLSETFQSLPDASEPPSGDDGFVDEHALVDRFRLTLPPAGQPLLYFVPRGALRERLTQLLGSDATAQPVFVALKEPSFDDHRGDLLATAVSLNVGLALAVPGKVCGVASPTPAATSSNGGHTFTPTPVVTATLHPTASVTATASPSSTATALRSATPTPVITGTPARTATAAATAAGTVTATVTATPTRVDTATPTVQTTTTVTATSSPVPSLPASTRTAGPIATPTATSLVSSGATPTPPIGIPEIVLEDRTVALRSRGNDTYVRVVVTNPTTVELGRMPYTATFTIDPADGQVSVTTREIQGRPVISAGYKDYLRVGITTAADAQPGEYRLTGVFRFSPTSLPAGSPPIQITRTARVRIE